MTGWHVAFSTSTAILLGMAAAVAQVPSAGAVYSESQAAAGKVAYLERCAACHAEDLSGTGDPPALAGADFLGTWKTRTTKDLLQYLPGMPPGGPPLSAEQYLAVVSFILQQNGAPSGDQRLTDTTNAVLGSIATGERPRQ